MGTPWRLHYESDRVPGYTAARTIQIPVTGPTPPGPLHSAELQVIVAGQPRQRFSFPASPNQTHAFTWDGLDAYGRALQGRAPIRVELSYRYEGLSQGLRSLVGKTRVWRGEIGTWDNRYAGLGGWSLSPHHA